MPSLIESLVLLLAGLVHLPLCCLGNPTGTSSADLCYPVNDTLTAIYDPFAGASGYYTFAECGTTVQPTIGLRLGVTYTFLQHDASNWYHPLGFAYFADGAHKEVDELEPGIAPPGAADMSCADALTCQAPMYFKNGEYVGGSYDNSVAPVVPGDDFGLDAYEPEFFLPRADWIEQGTYEVKLTLSDADTIDDVFYFCHIHNEMSGRIKIVDADGVPLRADDAPELGYEYDVISDFDASCGTHDAYPYRAGAGACSDTFICADGSTETSEQLAFAECLHAIDCAMEYNMRSTLDPTNPITTFIHQMIPHHDNAINMAKLLLKQDVLDADSDMYHMLWDIINTQNFQIDTMQAWLDDNDAPRTAVCSLCNDSASWHKRGDPSKDCAWVAQWSPRCTVKGEDRELAEVGCPEACGICSNPDGVLIGSS